MVVNMMTMMMKEHDDHDQRRDAEHDDEHCDDFDVLIMIMLMEMIILMLDDHGVTGAATGCGCTASASG